jgi:hypothetical protein
MIKNQRVKLFTASLFEMNFTGQTIWSSDGLATALGVAAALAFATVLAFGGAAAALSRATVFALAIVLAGVAARRVRAGRVRAVLRVSFRRDARQQSGDRCGDEESSLGSGHIFGLVSVYSGIHAQNQLRAGIKSALELILDVRYAIQ